MSLSPSCQRWKSTCKLGWSQDFGGAWAHPFAVFLARDLKGPDSSAKNLVVRDGSVWTGGLDACLRRWDLRMAKVSMEYPFQSQVHSQGCSWTGMAIGLDDKVY